MTPAIFGLEGLVMSSSERDFFRDSAPMGYILFGRNVENRNQLRQLTDDLRELHGSSSLPILIDQEGGRVARMQSPEWFSYPPAAVFESVFVKNPEAAVRACRANFEALALDLAEVGITVTCAPVLDVPVDGAHDVIGDRAFARDPECVSALGRACLEGLLAAGVDGVIKHIPGHGRAAADSHLALPQVSASHTELANDLIPFKALADASMAMTAHVIYERWDSERCATLSPTVIQDVIRGEIGFDGLLMSDDLDMKALSGDIGDLAREAQAAGCDVVLNCWAKMNDMVAIAEKMSAPSSKTLDRIQRVMRGISTTSPSEKLKARQHVLLEMRDALLAS
ncbi:MAG: beta-N-acetylhexosaminidase [Halieaceae bacterium]|jgi:beta-N-acetylhexosaminidase